MAEPVNDPFASPPSMVSPTPTTPPPGAPPLATPDDATDSPRRSPWPMVAVASVAVAAVIVGVVVLTGDDSSSGASTSAGSLHLLTYDDDGLSVGDVNGDDGDSIATPDDFRPRFRAVNGRWLVGEPHGASVDVVDLSTGDSTQVDLGHEDMVLNDATVIPGHDHVLFSSSQGPVVAVDLAAGEAEQLSRGSHEHVIGGQDGEIALYPRVDGELTTLLVPLERPTDAWEVPGRVLSWDGERTLVAVHGDDGATIARYDRDETTDDGVTIDAPLAGGLLTGDGGLIIDTGGAIFRVDTAGGDKETIGTLGFGVDFAFGVSADRLFVGGPDRTALVDADGSVVVEFEPAEDPDGELQPLVPFGNVFGTECFVLQPGYRPYHDGVQSIAVRLDDGSTVASIEGSAAIVDGTGCSIIGTTSGALSIDGEAVDLDGAEATAVTPDHRYVLAIDRSGDDPVHLLIDLESGDRTELESGVHVFATF